MFQISRKSIRQCSTALAAVFLLSGSAMAAERTYTFKIPEENAALALNDFAQQAGVHIIFPYDLAAAKKSPAISGKFTRAEVLARILKDTGLEVAEETETSITLRPATDAASKASVSADEPATEVVVTGTHIRNTNPTSPVHVISRVDIDQSGYSQIGDLMRSQPENFGGGQNPGLTGASASNIANQNISNASTVNLRGLGTDATLILVNGHRLNADSFYQGSDISGVPLAAVQRIEVVPDGASALYGSDAVAGVVNIILRKNLNGGEFSGRIGAPSQAGGQEQTFSLLQGFSGSRSHVLANFEYSRQEPILAGERDFTSGMDPTYRLLRFQERRSFFLNAGYEPSDRTTLGIDVLVYDRRAVNGYTSAKQRYEVPYYTPAYNVAPSISWKLPGDWNLKAIAVASGSRNAYWLRNLTKGTTTHSQYENWNKYIEVTADGPLFKLPSGVVKGAFGGGYRVESYQDGLAFKSSTMRPSRNVSYLYGEALVPLVVPSSEREGLQELDVSLSARTERYSDMGSSTSPKIGIRYVPYTGMTVRATWGKSFKAPSLIQMYSSSTAYLYDAQSLGSSTAGAALLLYGGNADLKPERSTSWTVGADYRLPANLAGIVGFTYFNIDYTDRVVQPISNVDQALSDPLYAPFVKMAPSVAQQSAAIDGVTEFTNIYAATYDPSQVLAILEDQYQNATSQTAHGVDISYRQAFSFSNGELSAFANGTWIRLNQQTIVTMPNAQLSGTLFNVPDFRGRAGATWTSGNLSATGIVNYMSGQLDKGVNPSVELASGTTVDATVSYRTGQGAGLSHGLRFAMSVSNLFDKDPPRTLSPLSQTVAHFDSTTGSIIGRVVSLTVSKAW